METRPPPDAAATNRPGSAGPAAFPASASPPTSRHSLPRRPLATAHVDRKSLPVLVVAALVLLAALGGLLLARDAVPDARWYLPDDSPLQATLSASPEAEPGVITAVLAEADPGRAAQDSLRATGAPLTPTAQLTVTREATGPLDELPAVWAEARDLSAQRNRSRRWATLDSDSAPLSITVALDASAVPQGSVLVVRVGLSRPATVTAAYDGRPLTLVGRSDTALWGLLGFAPDARLVEHTLAFSATDRLGNASQAVKGFRVTSTRFIVEDIVLPPDRVGLSNTAEESRRLTAALATASPVPLWKDLFLVPVPGRVTSPFGEGRSYNGGPVASYHAGVDLAGGAGAPVAATAAGRVVLAQKVAVQGNTVVLDHGLGLVSAYYHLAEVGVRPGDFVRRGQAVGLVGDTGLSTGPHLHWELRLNGVPVDPWEWTRREIP